MKKISLQDMLEAGVHFGHRTSHWHPKMGQYVFGSRNGVHIIDLAKTAEKLEAAQQIVADVAHRGGIVLFVGTKRQAHTPIKAAAERAGMPYVTERWLGGTFTNFKAIASQVRKMKTLEEKFQKGEFRQYTKFEQARKQEELEKLQKFFSGIRLLDRIPDVVFFVDIKTEKIALHEATSMRVKTIALCDTNVNPELVTHAIPGNDDAIRSIELITQAIADAIVENKGQVTPAPAHATPVAVPVPAANLPAGK